ncbi:hypothetical protein CG478_000955 [Bacillus cytotoxicus]|uniref:hypothetical protein n=1 Tax=Bacillus cytotoxicus TaxID=580165 RepID=UPI000B979199|nr:hypothetical protein [Bacillus cytotoxicus]AWC27142.1 hypothetical protein CG483_000955 [Bacillus cytotoxicus]AWC39256.1 hypothetical protein CG480_000955 [Bacillus cytotoxicus]AWC47187.1 hypothetical protein CG478_000955 [Bacillus cytotoxicus]AWC51208.1 hypothetical protein CG477_000955 [Bacillus cytotoxicus]AWC55337.1 hypothetical protein CG476_000955 [Bacillus cytotoxicus]
MAKRGRPKKHSLPEELQRKIEALEAETDEVKIKEMKKLMKKEPEICGAIQGNGRVCLRAPWKLEDGSINNGRCATHGGKPNTRISKDPERRARQLANLHPKARLIHGMYSKNVQFTQEEAEFYNKTIEHFVENYPEDVDPINMSLLHRFAINHIKVTRQESTDFLRESRSNNSFDKLMQSFAQDLGLNKRYKDSKEHKNNPSNGDIALLFMDDNEN